MRGKSWYGRRSGTVADRSASHRSSFVRSGIRRDQDVKLTGKVVEMRWSNPHAWIYLDVVGASGKTERWAFETGAANGLFRRGWRKEDLPAGTVLVIQGWRARNGSNTANASTITFQDGKRLFAGSSNPNAEKAQ